MMADALTKFMAKYTPEERVAIDHVRERLEVDGAHSLNGCPGHCRALCSYRATIIAMVNAGTWPEDLA
jgi:hypothetical protein